MSSIIEGYNYDIFINNGQKGKKYNAFIRYRGNLSDSIS
jgi:hypothetical protein